MANQRRRYKTPLRGVKRFFFPSAAKQYFLASALISRAIHGMVFIKASSGPPQILGALVPRGQPASQHVLLNLLIPQVRLVLLNPSLELRQFGSRKLRDCFF
jgi:hypothetical protein